jgi:hypothetical protein
VDERHRQNVKSPVHRRARRRPPRRPPTVGVRRLSGCIGFELRTDSQADRGRLEFASSSSTQGSREQRMGALHRLFSQRERGTHRQKNRSPRPRRSRSPPRRRTAGWDRRCSTTKRCPRQQCRCRGRLQLRRRHFRARCSRCRCQSAAHTGIRRTRCSAAKEDEGGIL